MSRTILCLSQPTKRATSRVWKKINAVLRAVFLLSVRRGFCNDLLAAVAQVGSHRHKPHLKEGRLVNYDAARRGRYDRTLLRGIVNRINELRLNGDVDSKEFAFLARLLKQFAPSTRRLVEMPRIFEERRQLARTTHRSREELLHYLWWVTAGIIGASSLF